MAPSASLEMIAGVLRLHPPGGGAGGPFDWSCVVVRQPDGVALLKAAPGSPTTPGAVAALARALLAAGFTAGRWERLETDAAGRSALRTTRAFDLARLAGRSAA